LLSIRSDFGLLAASLRSQLAAKSALMSELSRSAIACDLRTQQRESRRSKSNALSIVIAFS